LRIRYQVKDSEKEQILWERLTGWTNSKEDSLTRAQAKWPPPEKLEGKQERLLSKKEIKERVVSHGYYPNWLKQARTALRCELREFDLPNKMGKGLLAISYFQLPDGRSLVFLFKDEHNRLHEIPNLGRYEGDTKYGFCCLNEPFSMERDISRLNARKFF